MRYVLLNFFISLCLLNFFFWDMFREFLMLYKDWYVLLLMFFIIILFVSFEMYSGFDGFMDGVFFN